MKISNNQDNGSKLFVIENHAAPSPHNIARVVKDEVVFTFKDGIPAFEDTSQYALSYNEKISPFLYLNSLDVQGLGFVCIDPFIVYAGVNTNK